MLGPEPDPLGAASSAAAVPVGCSVSVGTAAAGAGSVSIMRVSKPRCREAANDGEAAASARIARTHYAYLM